MVQTLLELKKVRSTGDPEPCSAGFSSAYGRRCGERRIPAGITESKPWPFLWPAARVRIRALARAQGAASYASPCGAAAVRVIALAIMVDGQGIALAQGIGGDSRDPSRRAAAAADAKCKAQAPPLGRQARPESDNAAMVAHPGKAIDQRHPRAADRGDMRAVHHVAADVRQVHRHREVEVLAAPSWRSRVRSRRCSECRPTASCRVSSTGRSSRNCASSARG